MGTISIVTQTGRGKRHTLTVSTLEELPQREEESIRDKSDGIRAEAKNVTLDDMFELWSRLKRGLKGNTYQNYCYMYRTFVSPGIGKIRISTLKRLDIKAFYNSLADEKNLKIATILHQVLTVAVEDGYMRTNISDNLLKELKQSHNTGAEHGRALTVPEQELFLDFLNKENTPYHHWKPIFTVMLYTGMRVGEITGLRWEDIDIDEDMIEVNHTLVYYNHAENGCYLASIHQRRKLETVPYLCWMR